MKQLKDIVCSSDRTAVDFCLGMLLLYRSSFVFGWISIIFGLFVLAFLLEPVGLPMVEA